jgi:hypothetical protein
MVIFLAYKMVLIDGYKVVKCIGDYCKVIKDDQHFAMKTCDQTELKNRIMEKKQIKYPYLHMESLVKDTI